MSVTVSSGNDPQMPVEITVVDDGEGMDASMLGAALTFGGSSRFNDRSSLGRYGMGLPNGTLSRSRRVEVYTWRGEDALSSVLDLDRITAEGEDALPAVEPARPPFPVTAASGTAVRLLRCEQSRVPQAVGAGPEAGRGTRQDLPAFPGRGPSTDGKREAGRPVRPAVPAAGIDLDRGAAIR